jgi:Sec-independent protein translocase protein TatA
MLAFLSNLHFTELILIALMGIMVFGRNLPRIAVQIWTQLTKMRRSMNKVWRETGVQDEIRRMQREMREAEYEVRDAARRAVEAEEEAEAAAEGGEEQTFEGAEHDEHYHDTDAGEEMSAEEEELDEPEGEAARRADPEPDPEPEPGPDPYPGNTNGA